MAEENPSYYAIIPASVRYDSSLCANAKLLYGEISALTNKHGFCYASNQYFSALYGASDRSISRWIKNLSDSGYIRIEIIDLNSRKIYIFEGHKLSQDRQNCHTGATKLSRGYDKIVMGPRQNCLHNIKDNTTDNIKDNKPDYSRIHSHVTSLRAKHPDISPSDYKIDYPRETKRIKELLNKGYTEDQIINLLTGLARLKLDNHKNPYISSKPLSVIGLEDSILNSVANISSVTEKNNVAKFKVNKVLI